MIRRVSFVILALVVVAGYLFAQKTSSFNGFELADKTGKILRKPADYRDHYEILGAWTVLDPKGNQMHLTYASPVLRQNSIWRTPDRNLYCHSFKIRSPRIRSRSQPEAFHGHKPQAA
jgi:hypothetical protein